MSLEFPLGYPLGLPEVPATDLSGEAIGFALDPAAATLGVDIGSVPDIDPTLALVSGYQALGESIARRLETPRGGLFYDGDYGTDIRGRLNDSFTPAEIFSLQSDIEAEAEKEERVQSASATVTFDAASSSMNIQLGVVAATGPFRFVLSADALSVQLLDAS